LRGTSTRIQQSFDDFFLHIAVLLRQRNVDVTLTLVGESPLKYFDRAPSVRVSAAGRSLATFSPAADFTQEIVLPADALAAAGGRVIVESDEWFSPQARGQGADRRHLAIRVYAVSVK